MQTTAGTLYYDLRLSYQTSILGYNGIPDNDRTSALVVCLSENQMHSIDKFVSFYQRQSQKIAPNQLPGLLKIQHGLTGCCRRREVITISRAICFCFKCHPAVGHQPRYPREPKGPSILIISCLCAAVVVSSLSLLSCSVLLSGQEFSFSFFFPSCLPAVRHPAPRIGQWRKKKHIYCARSFSSNNFRLVFLFH